MEAKTNGRQKNREGFRVTRGVMARVRVRVQVSVGA